MDAIRRTSIILFFPRAPRSVQARQDPTILSSPGLIYGFPGSHGSTLDRKCSVVSYGTVAKVPEPASGERSELTDYKCGYSARGHSVPEQDMAWSVNAMSSTFPLSNMSPQGTCLDNAEKSVSENGVGQIATQSVTYRVWAGTILSSIAMHERILFRRQRRRPFV